MAMLDIIFEDAWIIAINKPHGLLVHRSSLARDVSEFALQQVRDHIGAHVFPFHRLDRKTSGVLIFAKTKEVAHAMQTTFACSSTTKEYLALVRGFFPTTYQLDHPLTNEKGVKQSAQTDFRCLQHYELALPFGKFPTSRYSFIAAYPKTGRMHQIRKHLNHLRFPIIGDRPHGCNKQNRLFKSEWNMTTMMLHARSVAFIHPMTGQSVTVNASMSDEFQRMIAVMAL
jgi:tRNA pseudouridine65 synthase